MKLRIGQMLTSPVDTTTVVVIRSPDLDVEITCGGVPMVPKDEPVTSAGSLDLDLMGGSLLGKRYASEELGLELLCAKGGKGTLTANGVPIEIKNAKPLPASD
jgi:hypothetical protein